MAASENVVDEDLATQSPIRDILAVGFAPNSLDLLLQPDSAVESPARVDSSPDRTSAASSLHKQRDCSKSPTLTILINAASRLTSAWSTSSDEGEEESQERAEEQAEKRKVGLRRQYERAARAADMAVTQTSTQVFIDGSFEDLAEELAEYMDNVKPSDVKIDVKPLLEAGQKDEALKKLVSASSLLNAAPEKEFTAAYNLLIYLLTQSPNVNNYLQKVCENLSRPITSSPNNGTGLALSLLSTLFNLLPADNELRSNVFSAILRVLKTSAQFDLIKPQLAKIPQWIKEWDMDEEDQRKLYLQIAQVAEESGEETQAYQYTLRALRTFDQSEAASKEAHDLSVRAVKAALISPSHFDYNDLRAIPAIHALSESEPAYHELLNIFGEKELEDYNDFNEEYDTFLETEQLDGDVLYRKMRLLTLTSLAASTNSREVEYERISKALQIPANEVEMWVIDVIRAGLVEGKLSQQKKTLLLHRCTYRVFTEKQWKEVDTRLESWKTSLRAVLEVVKSQRIATESGRMAEINGKR